MAFKTWFDVFLFRGAGKHQAGEKRTGNSRHAANQFRCKAKSQQNDDSEGQGAEANIQPRNSPTEARQNPDPKSNRQCQKEHDSSKNKQNLQEATRTRSHCQEDGKKENDQNIIKHGRT